MATTSEYPADVPMSVRMRRVLLAFQRKPIAERFQLLVKAGLMTEAEAQQAVERQGLARKDRRKPKARRKPSAKKTEKPDQG